MSQDYYTKRNFLVGLETPVAPTGVNDVPNKAYVDAAVAGATNHLVAARLESTSNIDISTGGLLVVDGVQTVAGDRILLNGQTDPIENGVYVAAEGAWSRAADVADGATLLSGTDIYIEEGTAYHGYVQALTDEVVVGTDAQTWAHISTRTNDADQVSYDPSGNTVLTGTDVQAALDQAETAFSTVANRVDSITGTTQDNLGTFSEDIFSDNASIKTVLQEAETAIANIDVTGQVQTFYDGKKFTQTGVTIQASGWTSITHNLGDKYLTGIEIYDQGDKRMTSSFDYELIDANTFRIQNEYPVALTNMQIVCRV